MGTAVMAEAGHMGHAAYRAVMPRESISMAEGVMTDITGTALRTGSAGYPDARRQRDTGIMEDIIMAIPVIADTDSAKYQAVRGQKDIDMAENIIMVIPTTV